MLRLIVIAGCALSFNERAIKSVEVRLAGIDSANRLSRFVDYHANARKDIFIPNTNFWAKGIDFSCASPWNSVSGPTRAGTLISKRHIVYAAHYPLAIGSRIVFVDSEGNVCPCYLDKAMRIEGSDIMVGLLNAEVTPNIKPAKLFPEDGYKYVEKLGSGLPVATFNKKEQLFLTESNVIVTNKAFRNRASSRIPRNKKFAGYGEKIIEGDSGNPAFLLLNDEPVLVYCLNFGWCGSGPALYLHLDELQKAMDELCTGYKLEFYDFKSACDK